MDKIFLHGLTAEAIIGVWDWERKVKQKVIIDLEMAATVKKAAASDSIEDTLNYKNIAKRLLEFVEQSEFQLVESLAEAVAGVVTGELNVPWVKVTLHKPGAIRGSQDVGVIIERGVIPEND